MLRRRLGSPSLLLLALGACSSAPSPEPLPSYGASALDVLRGRDINGVEILYANLMPGDSDACPPLAPVHASVDGRSLAVHPGGADHGRTCFGATFTAPLVVLRRGTDEHELRIEGDGAVVRARAVDLASSARLVAKEGSPVVVALDREVRGRPVEVHATWSATEPASARIDGGRVLVDVADAVKASPRAVLDILVIYDLDVTACEGVPSCRARWLVHDAFDLATGP